MSLRFNTLKEWQFYIDKILSVNGELLLGNNTDISGKLTVTEDVSINGNLDVDILNASEIITTILRASNIDMSLQTLVDISNAHYNLINTNKIALAASDLSIAHIIDTSDSHYNLINQNTILLSALEGIAEQSKALIIDENKDITGIRNITTTGTITGTHIGDISLIDFNVSVASKTSNHPYNGLGSGSGYILNN